MPTIWLGTAFAAWAAVLRGTIGTAARMPMSFFTVAFRTIAAWAFGIFMVTMTVFFGVGSRTPGWAIFIAPTAATFFVTSGRAGVFIAVSPTLRTLAAIARRTHAIAFAEHRTTVTTLFGAEAIAIAPWRRAIEAAIGEGTERRVMRMVSFEFFAARTSEALAIHLATMTRRPGELTTSHAIGTRTTPIELAISPLSRWRAGEAVAIEFTTARRAGKTLA